jgi:hypothetical protein
VQDLVGFLHMVTAAASKVECLGPKKRLDSQLVCGRLKIQLFGTFGLRVEMVGEFWCFGLSGWCLIRKIWQFLSFSEAWFHSYEAKDKDIWDNLGKHFVFWTPLEEHLGKDKEDVLESDSAEKTQPSFKTILHLSLLLLPFLCF